MREEEETPKMEASSHSREFLKKAAELSKVRGKKGVRKVSARRSEKKHGAKKRATKKLSYAKR